jgi:PAS domain S-box-containing protein
MTSGAMRVGESSRIEADLRHYRELFDGSPDGYVLTDAHGAILEGNRTLAAMLGVHSRFLDRKLLVNFVARRDVRRFRVALARLASGEGDGEFVSLCLRPRHGHPPFVAELAPRLVRGAGDRVTSIRWGVRKARSNDHPSAGGDKAQPGGERTVSVAADLHALLRTVHAAGAALARELANGPTVVRALIDEVQRSSARLLHLAGEPVDRSALEMGELGPAHLDGPGIHAAEGGDARRDEPS